MIDIFDMIGVENGEMKSLRPSRYFLRNKTLQSSIDINPGNHTLVSDMDEASSASKTSRKRQHVQIEYENNKDVSKEKKKKTKAPSASTPKSHQTTLSVVDGTLQLTPNQSPEKSKIVC